jgi:hypothetical protein
VREIADLSIARAASVALVAISALSGCGSDSNPHTSVTREFCESTRSRTEPIADCIRATNRTKRDLDQANLHCGYKRDGHRRGNHATRYLLTASGTLRNHTGHMIVARVTASWERRNKSPRIVRRSFRISSGQTRRVYISVPETHVPRRIPGLIGGGCATSYTVNSYR